MSRLYLSLALLLALLGGSLLHAGYVEEMTGELAQSLRAAQVLAERGGWEEARRLTRQAREEWEGQRAYVYLFLRHTDADQILLSFRTVEDSLKGERPDLRACCAALELLAARLELLGEMEQPHWLNVL